MTEQTNTGAPNRQLFAPVPRVFAPMLWGGAGVFFLLLLLSTSLSPALATQGTAPVQSSLNNMVLPAQVITASFTTNAPVCLGSSIRFSDTSSAPSGIKAVEWDLGDGATSTKRVVNHTYAAAGTYTVWLTATSQVDSQHTISKPVSVQSVSAGIDITPFYNGNTVCRNATTTFADGSALGVPSSASTWQWTVNGAPVSVASSFSYIFTTYGPHSVNLAVTTSAGCADTTSISLNAADPPVPNLVITAGSDPAEAGTTVHFEDRGTGGVSWTWDFGDGIVITTTTPSIDHVYKYSGSRTVVLTVAAASGCTAADSETLAVTGKDYIPLIVKNYFTGWEFRDDFGDWNSGWTWGEHVTLNPDGSKSDEFYFGYKMDTNRLTRSDGSLYYILAHDDEDHVFLTGPQDKALVYYDFTYEASARTASNNRRGDEYGILISPVPLDPRAPNSQGLPVYTCQIRLKNDDTKRHWVFKKWTIANSHDHPADELAIGTEVSWLTSNTYWWNRFKIERVGNTITCSSYAEESWTKWQPLASRDMSLDFASVPDKFYVGFYLAHSEPYSYDFEAQFEDVIAISRKP